MTIGCRIVTAKRHKYKSWIHAHRNGNIKFMCINEYIKYTIIQSPHEEYCYRILTLNLRLTLESKPCDFLQLDLPIRLNCWYWCLSKLFVLFLTILFFTKGVTFPIVFCRGCFYVNNIYTRYCEWSNQSNSNTDKYKELTVKEECTGEWINTTKLFDLETPPGRLWL